MLKILMIVEVIVKAVAGGGSSSSSMSTVTYHVHRNIIGPRSEYFTRLFCQPLSDGNANQNGDNDVTHGASFSDSRNRHSRIEFSSVLTNRSFASIVKAFETFLDYCYFETAITVTRFEDEQLSPVALHFLTDYFQLQHEDFMNHSVMYTEKERKALLYKEAASQHDETNKEKQNVLCLWCTDIINFRSEGLNVETIQTIFLECCCENRKCLSPGSLLSKIIDTPLWLCITSKQSDNNLPQRVYSMDWSENVSYFIHNDTTGSIENNAFRILTNDTFIPNIHPTAAIILLNEERTRGLHDLPIQEIPVTEAMTTTAKTTEDEDYDEIDGHTANKKDDDDTMLSNSQERCIGSFDSANLEQESNEDLREEVLNVMLHTVMKAYLRKNLVRTRQTIAAKNNKINQAKKQFISERLKNERQLQDKYDLVVRMRPVKQLLRKSIMDIIFTTSKLMRCNA